MRKQYILVLLVVTSLFATDPTVSQATEKVKLAQFGKEKFLLYLPLYIALERGYFRERGLEVELVFAGNDDQVFAAVAGGAVDFGVADPVFTAIAQERGFQAKTVAMLISKLGNSGYTNNPAIPKISEVAQLANLRIGSLPKPSTTFTLLEKLKRQNAHTLAQTRIVEAGMGGQLALLEADEVDIALDLEPTASLLESKGYRIVFNLNEHIEPQVITGLMTTESTIAERPAIVQTLVSGLEEALRTIHYDTTEAIAVAKAIFPSLPAAVVEKAVSRMLKKEVYPTSTLIPDLYWQRSLQVRLDSGQLKHAQETSVSIENRFARFARVEAQRSGQEQAK